MVFRLWSPDFSVSFVPPGRLSGKSGDLLIRVTHYVKQVADLCHKRIWQLEHFQPLSPHKVCKFMIGSLGGSVKVKGYERVMEGS
jgi:hypothetical protein